MMITSLNQTMFELDTYLEKNFQQLWLHLLFQKQQQKKKNFNLWLSFVHKLLI